MMNIKTAGPEKKIDPTQQRNMLIGLGMVVSFCLICICVGAFFFSGNGAKDYKTMAYIQCQLHVQDKLKAPSSADFPASSSTNIQDAGNNTFEIRSYVDAQNSFGAKLRTYFFCKIQYTGTPKDDETNPRFWNLLQLDFIE